jgi:hypothetical protein
MTKNLKNDKQFVSVCYYCVRKFKNGPKYASTNGLEFTLQPPELKNLNFIEKNLIELVHPIQSNFWFFIHMQQNMYSYSSSVQSLRQKRAANRGKRKKGWNCIHRSTN